MDTAQFFLLYSAASVLLSTLLIWGWTPLCSLAWKTLRFLGLTAVVLLATLVALTGVVLLLGWLSALPPLGGAMLVLLWLFWDHQSQARARHAELMQALRPLRPPGTHPLVPSRPLPRIDFTSHAESVAYRKAHGLPFNAPHPWSEELSLKRDPDWIDRLPPVTASPAAAAPPATPRARRPARSAR